ncbi:MAG: DUF222 domain-containing protein [Candidatus Dormibacteria bacterium]
MCDGAQQGPPPSDLIASFTAIAEALAGRDLPERDSSTLRDELRRIRHALDLGELAFSKAAALYQSDDLDDCPDSTSTFNWIRHACKMTVQATSRAISVGRNASDLKLSVGALEQGRIGFGHLALIASTASAIRGRGPDHWIDEPAMLEQAEAHSVSQFIYDCKHARHAADAEAVLREQATLVDFRRLQLTPCGQGGIAIDGLLDDAGAATLRAALEPLARRNGFADTRKRDKRLADALVELANHRMDEGSLPRRNSQRPHVRITATVETLQGAQGAAAGDMEFSQPVPAATVQRLACDAGVARVLLSADSAVLDVGRARRLPGVATRRALEARDRGCVWPGCDRRPTWTNAHHIKHWAHGGDTSMANLALVCYRHHWLLHEGGWQLVGADEGFVVIPPISGRRLRPREPDLRPAA